MIKLIVIVMALLTGCSSTVNNSGDITKTDTNIIYAYIDDNILEINLEDNSSAEAFLKHLKENDIVVDMSDYGGFEKVGDLGFNLQKNDININATSGYVILQIYKAKKYPINFNRVLFYIKLIFYFIGI